MVGEVFHELGFLKELKHNFVCNMYHAFQDNINIYMVLDLALGGDLRFYLGKQDNRCLTMEQVISLFSFFNSPPSQ